MKSRVASRQNLIGFPEVTSATRLCCFEQPIVPLLAALHGVVVCHYRLQNDAVISAIFNHLVRGEFFCIVYSQVARFSTRGSNVLFEKYEW